MATAMSVGARTSRSTQELVAQSQEAQLVSTYFVPDVENASMVISNNPSLPCGSAVSTKLISLKWTEPTMTGVAVTAFYYLTPGFQNVINRRVCRGTTLSSDNVLAAHVSGTPTVTCSPAVCEDSTPNNVRLSITSHVPSSGTPPYDYTVQATPRSTPNSGIANQTGRLVIFGSTGGINTTGSGAQVQIGTGVAFVGGPVTQNSHGSITDAGGFYYSGPGGCSTVQFTASPATPCTSTSAAPVDPYAGVDYTTLGVGQCLPVGRPPSTSHTCSPGYFLSSFVMSDVYTFSPGFYLFQNGFSASSSGWGITTTGTGRVVLYSRGPLDFQANSTHDVTDTPTAPLSIIAPSINLGGQPKIIVN